MTCEKCSSEYERGQQDGSIREDEQACSMKVDLPDISSCPKCSVCGMEYYTEKHIKEAQQEGRDEILKEPFEQSVKRWAAIFQKGADFERKEITEELKNYYPDESISEEALKVLLKRLETKNRR